MFFNRKAELSDTSAVLEAFKFIENAAAEFSDEDEEDDSEGKDRTHVESRTVNKSSLSSLGARTQTHNEAEIIHVLFNTTLEFFFPSDSKKETRIIYITSQYGHH